MNEVTHWRCGHPVPFGRTAIEQLLRAEVPAVELADFANAEEMRQFLSELRQFQARSQSVKQVVRLGISQYQEGVKGSKRAYFARAAELSAAQQAIFQRSFDPLHRFVEHLRGAGFDAQVMEEPGFGAYYAGVGKSREGESPIHVDFAPQDSPDWEVGKAPAQLSWNLYLNTPQGGALVIWDKLWNPRDDVHQVADNYYYGREVVAGARRIELPVQEGDLLLLNSRNFHAIASTPNRIAFGSFISFFPDNRLRLWS